ncbi:protein of unknown function [Cupriavidus taiwanensis]|uniref:Uncharacterized protein n=1 Tax=Cupriavidus taiwanensis TaxID=164546 RepID=A0A7Z7NKM8_9BURK|nr:protein of unknown function [Cupriavidus taiwanensis]SOZ01729.1 hypothetical protein CBM2595_A30569 [Cupriavidus taiwanensis]SOZ04756.1 hypothetical protein CBM2597_A50708 [Cupriavidus taiwanensis]SPC09239.1 hypothetical protein CBM2594_A40562 [Cupriavidus taiwanensis]SPD39031.1 protein of unknown function [Cupriavidus taiwanensis]
MIVQCIRATRAFVVMYTAGEFAGRQRVPGLNCFKLCPQSLDARRAIHDPVLLACPYRYRRR